jgi:hypothetical protein
MSPFDSRRLHRRRSASAKARACTIRSDTKAIARKSTSRTIPSATGAREHRRRRGRVVLAQTDRQRPRLLEAALVAAYARALRRRSSCGPCSWRQARLVRFRRRDPQSLNAGARCSPVLASEACLRLHETRAPDSAVAATEGLKARPASLLAMRRCVAARTSRHAFASAQAQAVAAVKVRLSSVRRGGCPGHRRARATGEALAGGCLLEAARIDSHACGQGCRDPRSNRYRQSTGGEDSERCAEAGDDRAA